MKPATSTHLCFQNVSRYRYRLTSDYVYTQSILIPKKEINTRYIDLSVDGVFSLANEYAWDGASGPVFNEKDVIRASLIHDACYQLIRLGELDMSYRDKADRLFEKICVDDGVNKMIAKVYYNALKLFGESSAIGPDKPPKTECIK